MLSATWLGVPRAVERLSVSLRRFLDVKTGTMRTTKQEDQIMANYRVISSDNHVFEPPDLWSSRAKPAFRDRVPQLVREYDGDWWFCDGHRCVGMAGGAQTGMRFEAPEQLVRTTTFDNIRLGGYIPEEHLKDMDADGVDVSVVYPTVGLLLYSVPDSTLLSEIFRAYNDWLAEFCAAAPKRLKGIAMINVDDVAEGVGELERCARMGLAGGMITVYPQEGRGYDNPLYERLWAAAQDLDIPLAMHIATNRPGPGQDFSLEDRNRVRNSFLANADHWVRMSLGDMIFSGVFERYPKLQIGAVEHELSWIPHFLDRIDYTYTQRVQEERYRFKEAMLPSDYFHRNVFAGFQEDVMGIRDRHIIGVDNLLWGSDYPHVESTFPRTRQIIDEILKDCTDEEKVKIAGGNAARIYHLT
jgi:predicted TIM-barrel fold metal-dependent hydrolase